MVKNPPGYFVANQRQAIVIPDGDIDVLTSVAERYGARYIILERDHSENLDSLYNDPLIDQLHIEYLQSFNGIHIFELK